jgi:hypothetical protein
VNISQGPAQAAQPAAPPAVDTAAVHKLQALPVSLLQPFLSNMRGALSSAACASDMHTAQ